MRNNRPRVLLDCDGILFDFVTPALKIIKEVTGIVATAEDITEWDMMAGLGLTKRQGGECYDRMRDEGYCRNLPVYPGAQEGVDALLRFCDVHPVTAPFFSKTWVHERDGALKNYFGFSRQDVVHTSAKHLVSGDYLVDDKTDTLIAWHAEHITRHAVLWDHPYNRVMPTWPTPDPYHYRVKNWRELIDLIRRESRV